MSSKDYIFIKETREGIIKIYHKNILCIEAEKDYCIIFTSVQSYMVNITLHAIYSYLPQEIFHRCHRSFVVNVDNISNIKSNFIYVGDRTIPISGDKKDGLLEKINYLKTTSESKKL